MSCTKQQLQSFLDELPDDVSLFIDDDGITLVANYTDSNNSYQQKYFEIGGENLESDKNGLETKIDFPIFDATVLGILGIDTKSEIERANEILNTYPLVSGSPVDKYLEEIKRIPLDKAPILTFDSIVFEKGPTDES
jgi:hypothetical protein